MTEPNGQYEILRPSPVFLKFGKEEEFYIRVGPGSRRLSTSEVVAYVTKRRTDP